MMSLFDKKKYLSKGEFRKIIKEIKPRDLGFERKFSPRERLKMVKDIFGEDTGSHISKQDFKKSFKALKRKRFKAQDYIERIKMNRRVKFLERLGGEDIKKP
ncbi:hypothetical protein ACFL11_00220 [Patescibacteria group bacterium]